MGHADKIDENAAELRFVALGAAPDAAASIPAPSAGVRHAPVPSGQPEQSGAALWRPFHPLSRFARKSAFNPVMLQHIASSCGSRPRKRLKSSITRNHLPASQDVIKERLTGLTVVEKCLPPQSGNKRPPPVRRPTDSCSSLRRSRQQRYG